LMMNGQWLSGLFNLFGSALLGGLAVAAGIFLGRLI
jgi:fluoride ion exporter CrcB/FEX